MTESSGLWVGGREGIRTPDPLLAKQVLSQLSYTPTPNVLINFKASATTRKRSDVILADAYTKSIHIENATVKATQRTFSASKA